jgi:hypothetical protein
VKARTGEICSIVVDSPGEIRKFVLNMPCGAAASILYGPEGHVAGPRLG